MPPKLVTSIYNVYKQKLSILFLKHVLAKIFVSVGIAQRCSSDALHQPLPPCHSAGVTSELNQGHIYFGALQIFPFFFTQTGQCRLSAGSRRQSKTNLRTVCVHTHVRLHTWASVACLCGRTTHPN